MIINLKKKNLLFTIAGVLILILLLSSSFFWQIFYPIPHRDIIRKYSLENNIDPFLVTAIIRTESKFDSKAQSRRGARGLMQIMPETGQWIAQQMNMENFNVDDLYNEEFNIKLGTWYIANLMGQFDNEVVVIAAYNGGRGNVREWLNTDRWNGKRETLNDIPFEETADYVKKVLNYKKTYMQIYRSEF